MFSDSTYVKFNKKDYQRLFCLGAVLGGLIFILIYGVAGLNPTYTEWIFYADYDLRQHFVGWCHYRNTPWKFPIGLIDTLSYPVSMSTIYTDSIPGIALIFKLLSGILPQEFQYFGLVGFLFYILSGGTSVILLKRFIKSPWMCLIISPIFIVSFPMIQRMFYHTALAAQWLIFICFIIWVYDDFSEKSYRPVIIWAIMGLVCVSIHSYFLPMAGMIMLSDRICWYNVNKQVELKRKLLRFLLPIAAFCVTALLALWIYGGFYGSSSGVAQGLGTFGANLNTFINPGYYGVILPEMGYANYFQYEGCGYLGLGVILLSIFVDAVIVAKCKHKELGKNITSSQKMYILVTLGLFVVSFLAATLPTISWCTRNIVSIPYPALIYKLASVFRSNGRFIWIPMYLIMIATMVLGVRFLEENIAGKSKKQGQVLVYGVLVIVLIIQLADLSKMINEKHESFSKSDYSYATIWDSNQDLSDMTFDKKRFVFMYPDNDINMETAFYAYRHGMSVNSFYFARDINDEIVNNINIYDSELKSGMVRDDTVYIVKTDDFDSYRECIDLRYVTVNEIDGHVIFVSR